MTPVNATLYGFGVLIPPNFGWFLLGLLIIAIEAVVFLCVGEPTNEVEVRRLKIRRRVAVVWSLVVTILWYLFLTTPAVCAVSLGFETEVVQLQSAIGCWMDSVGIIGLVAVVFLLALIPPFFGRFYSLYVYGEDGE